MGTLEDTYDLLVIGGGVNGTAVARDAAGRGLSVLLCERDDLAEHTSSASSKLIHGGLRYLEYYEFRLVREALKEREVLLRAAPHIIWPMRFVLPYDKGLRPKWMLRAGLFLYDNLGAREILPGTETINLETDPKGASLESRFKTGFEYSDCWVEDARLVVLNARDAAERGADVLSHTEVTGLSVKKGTGYEASLKAADGTERTVTARGVVNAAGPWVEEVVGRLRAGRNESGLRLVKGSHIVVPRMFEGEHAFIFQNADGRVIFAIPYERDYTLIGTTDIPYSPIEGKPKASDEEISYLCEAANEYFENDISPADVAWTYSGVRPLYDDKSEDASAVTRDYVMTLDDPGGYPFLSVYGGKITTSRKLGEHALEKLEGYYPDMGKAWTRDAHLPGGDIEDADFESFHARMRSAHPEMDAEILLRLCRGYGTEVETMLAEGPGKTLPGGLVEAEIRHLVKYEWVTEPEDALWRRTKRGLHMNDGERAAFSEWFRGAFSNMSGLACAV